MFQIGITLLCAVFVIGYIFFAAASSEREETTEDPNFSASLGGSKKDAA